MKKIYFLLITFCFFTAASAQIISFPDMSFKAKLLEAGPANFIAANSSGNFIKIDVNDNGEIEINEALNVYLLNVASSQISNVAGLENFTNLLTLNCMDNNISNLNLNTFPNLGTLICNTNQLTVLDASNKPNLSSLQCGGNQLVSLNINNSNSITSLSYYNNQLPSIDLGNLPNLTRLDCSGNQVVSLANLNMHPSVNLVDLNCSNNLLTSLDLSNFNNLESFACSDNMLTGLDISNLNALTSLYSDSNQLTALNFSGAQLLEVIYCNNNNLVEVDVSGLSNLELLYCIDNSQLERIFIKNGISDLFGLDNLPNLNYICADAMELNDVENLISDYGYTNVVVNSYCSFTPGGEFYTIQGSNKLDNDSNGCDASDSPFPNLSFTISDGTNNGAFIANSAGSFSMPVQAGSHTVTPYFENPSFFNVSPSNVVVNFPTQTSPFTQNFCVTANGLHPDLEVMLVSTVPARPGFDANYKLIYKNKGTNTQSGTVSLIFDNTRLDFVSSAPTATTQTVGNLTWDFTNLQPFETREITLTFNVNSAMETPAVNGGDILNFTTTITSAATDEMPDDNTFNFNQTVVNSLDPNDKTCLQGPTIAPSEVGKYVHYMIRFENTGTFPAENIVVKDMIDTDKFDISTLVPIKGSHTFVTSITSGNKVEFIFENINLPFDDANNDGYVAFKIKTKPTLVVGNTFSNTASIYFDYNFPIVTNTATTTIQALSTQDFGFSTYFMLYPNPVSDVLNIETKQTIEVSSINIYNQLGQLVLVVPNAQNVSKVDVSSLSSGNYFIKINSDKGTSNTKFIKK